MEKIVTMLVERNDIGLLVNRLRANDPTGFSEKSCGVRIRVESEGSKDTSNYWLSQTPRE